VPSRLKPPPLQPKDKILVVAPASAPLDESKLEAGLAHLRALGYVVETGRSVYRAHGYLSGDDTVRLEELNAALARPDVKAIFCVRGGYGTLRLLPWIDYASARKHPKLIVGYSDITALQLALYRKVGLTSVAGAMVAVDWGGIDPKSEAQFWQVMSGAFPLDLAGPQGEPLHPVRPGKAEGTVLGGNLSLITRLLATPYLPPLEGAILFIEEVAEEPYRIDGMFAQLRLSGILDRLGGLVIGSITEWEPTHDRPSLALEDVLDHYLSNLPYPVAGGLLFGHVPEKISIPIGVRGRLAVGQRTASFQVLEGVVRT